MSGTVEVSEENGEYTAVDSRTGATGVGTTRALALAALAVRLGGDEAASGIDEESELRRLADRTRRRFEAEGITEDDVDEAIAWARSR